MRPSDECVERMEALVRRVTKERGEYVARTAAARYPVTQLVAEAMAIFAMLPEPPDPDIAIARQLIVETYGNCEGRREGPSRVRAIRNGEGDDYYEMRAVLAALKYERALHA